MLYPLELRAHLINIGYDALAVSSAGSFFTIFTLTVRDFFAAFAVFNEAVSTLRMAVLMSAVDTIAYRRKTLAVLWPDIAMHQFSGLPAATMLRIADRR